MTVAAIDRLVHRSAIFELHNVESYGGKVAERDQKKAARSREGRPWASIIQRQRQTAQGAPSMTR